MCWLGHGHSQDAKAKTIIGSWEQVKIDIYYEVNNFLELLMKQGNSWIQYKMIPSCGLQDWKGL